MFNKKQPPPSDFKSRVQAYEEARKKGLVFQAEGTLGGIPLRKRRRYRNGGRLFGLILVVGLLIAMKAGMFAYVGPENYRHKMMPYTTSTAPQDQIIAYVMQPDPATLWVAKLFTDVTFQVRILVNRYWPDPL